MAEFGIVDQDVKKILTVPEYIKTGMDITNDVTHDFVV